MTATAQSVAEPAVDVGKTGYNYYGQRIGSKGEGYFRISAFNSRANAVEVSKRLQKIKW